MESPALKSGRGVRRRSSSSRFRSARRALAFFRGVLKASAVDVVAKARRAATARSVGSVGSYGSGVPLTPSVLAKRDELATRDNETRQAREQILMDEEQEQALAQGEASEARIALTARNFWTSVRDAAIEVRIGNWILERREMHEREMREMHRNMKADYRFNKTERKDETFATMLALAAEEDATVDGAVVRER